ncbi:hypothetical protein SAMN02983003_1691 [Devosia enhydra]|uniref:DUF1109 family protein n=1 Tax=Devosia enhydra TaxID=665118 RepID=A0A1K2HYB8_9HYPH|nr:NrsF family protein [Devosia enhydra]SFZ83517.1 hypothetical protein SAMN02983003_1691 [Devosia enhydra]
MTDTSAMIARLAGDAGRRGPGFGIRLAGLVVLAAGVAATVFFATIGPRADIAAAAETIRFLAKFVLTLSLAGAALYLFDRLGRPGAACARHWLALLVPGAVLAAMLVGEAMTLPAPQWQAAMIGSNSLVCLTFIPLIGIGPLLLLIFGLRQGAPTRPGLAGVVAGVLAGAMAASFYAAHCTDDSPFFVLLWYSIAIAGLAAAGGVLGRIFARF